VTRERYRPPAAQALLASKSSSTKKEPASIANGNTGDTAKNRPPRRGPINIVPTIMSLPRIGHSRTFYRCGDSAGKTRDRPPGAHDPHWNEGRQMTPSVTHDIPRKPIAEQPMRVHTRLHRSPTKPPGRRTINMPTNPTVVKSPVSAYEWVDCKTYKGNATMLMADPISERKDDSNRRPNAL